LPSFLGIENVYLCVVDNLQQATLQSFCSTHEIAYVTHPGETLGFGANNNLAYRHFAANYALTAEDYLVCCNPDVLIAPAMLGELQVALERYRPQLAGINLFTDEQLTHFDNSIRRFPRLSDYLAKFLRRNSSMALDKAVITTPEPSDWAAGSFLIFSVPLFQLLKGFDERFFMYFEDVDICLRAWRVAGQRLLYLPDVRAVHYAAFRNRQLFSKHFYWYTSSLLRYLARFYLGGARDTAKGAPLQ
jgi:GT2 family glycosyltransferase